jgi:protein phosphatase
MLRMKLLSPEQAAQHPARSQLTRTIGGEPMVHVDLLRETIQRGDTFVLCSDGLWGDVASQEIAEVAGRLSSAQLPTAVAAADALVNLAIDRGAADNVTAVVVHISSGLPIPPQAARRRLRSWRGRA